ncbi:hypothetical protein CCACVL1_18689 [Corchorus capsularis]|uniref:Uncharacterized protein n=1 Tax=Corchorus capsularis TaxID=210143 RepID=A0A1R3HK00_COCAP|nr:hypothetical protein CCACVL1_18689 [Corchorus capsularis]
MEAWEKREERVFDLADQFHRNRRRSSQQ